MINSFQVSQRYWRTSQVSSNCVCDTRKLDLRVEFRRGPSQIGVELSQTTYNAKVVPVRISFWFLGNSLLRDDCQVHPRVRL